MSRRGLTTLAIVAAALVGIVVASIWVRQTASIDEAANLMRSEVEAAAAAFGFGERIEDVVVTVTSDLCQPTDLVAASAVLSIDLRDELFSQADVADVAEFWRQRYGFLLLGLSDRSSDSERPSVDARLRDGTGLQFWFGVEFRHVHISAWSSCYRSTP